MANKQIEKKSCKITNIMKPLVTEVSKSVFCVQRRDYLSCSYIVLRKKGVILIDSGIDPSSQDMIDGLNEVGKTVKDVKAILLTHWHNDHSSGASYIQEASKADIYYHEGGDLPRSPLSINKPESSIYRIHEKKVGNLALVANDWLLGTSK